MTDPTISGSPPDGWDGWVEGLGAPAGIYQSTTWATIDERANGARPWYVSVTGPSGLVAGAMVSEKPATTRAPLVQALRRVTSASASSALVALDGPVVDPGAGPEAVAAVLDGIDRLAATTGARVVHVAQPPGAVEPGPAAFEHHGYRASPWATSWLDLRPGLDELERGLKSETRKALRRAKREGLVVTECTTEEEYASEFLTAFRDGRAAAGLGVRTDDGDLELWRVGHPDRYRFFLCRDGDGVVLATLGTVRFGGRAVEVMSVRTRAGLASPLQAQDLVHWEAFAAHVDLGDHTFDLAGFSPSPADAKEAGIRRFKEKWGGEVLEVPRWDRATLPVAGRLLAPVRRARTGRPGSVG